MPYQSYIIPLPPNLHLTGGYKLVFEALDASDGSNMSGVNVSDVAVQVELLSAGAIEGIGPVLLTYAGDRSA